jgi:hypothetical protein
VPLLPNTHLLFIPSFVPFLAFPPITLLGESGQESDYGQAEWPGDSAEREDGAAETEAFG